MPISLACLPRIRQQLESIAHGQKVGIITVGHLTEQQHAAISAARLAHGLPALESAELVYLGRHHHQSRSADGYTIDDMLAQLVSGASAESRFLTEAHGTVLENATLRFDGYGFAVRDRIVLELTARKPRAEIFSVIPKADGGGPKNRKAP